MCPKKSYTNAHIQKGKMGSLPEVLGLVASSNLRINGYLSNFIMIRLIQDF